MKRALFLVAFWSLAVSPAMVQDPAKVVPKHYQVAEIGYSGSISRDGRLLAYAEEVYGDEQVFVQDLRTGDRRQLTNSSEGGEVLGVRLSRDGKQVAYGWEKWDDDSFELRILAVDGSARRVVYADQDLRWVFLHDWSTDGKQILATFWRKGGSHQFVLVSVADGSVRLLKTFNRRPQFAWESTMRLSPDGCYLAYDLPPREGVPQQDIFVLPTHGGRELPLVQHSANDRLLDWTPDGERILFASDRGGKVDAWLIQVRDGKAQGSPVLVKADLGPIAEGIGFTRDASYYYGLPGWSNDVYLTTLDPATGELQPPQKLVSHVGWDTSVEWSPAGHSLAYASGAGGTFDPFVLGIRSFETGKERRLRLDKLTRFGGHAFQPRWSPDSRFLLAQGRDRNYTGSGMDSQGLYRIDAQTGEVSPIVTSTSCPGDCVEWPVWSPDGRAIFIRWVPRRESIVARDLETGREKELYRAASPATVSHLAVSPDGQWLAFLWQGAEAAKTALKVISVTGGEARELINLSTGEPSPYGQPVFELAWTPDSRHIIYAPPAGQKPKFELWRISAEGGEPQGLGLTMEGLLPYGLSVHPDGQRIAFTAGTLVREEVWVLENFLPPLKTARGKSEDQRGKLRIRQPE